MRLSILIGKSYVYNSAATEELEKWLCKHFVKGTNIIGINMKNTLYVNFVTGIIYVYLVLVRKFRRVRDTQEAIESENDDDIPVCTICSLTRQDNWNKDLYVSDMQPTSVRV